MSGVRLVELLDGFGAEALATVAEKLIVGMVAPGHSAGRLTLRGVDGALAAPLAALGVRGWTGPQLGEAIEAMLAVRRRSEVVEVVSTQPGEGRRLLTATRVGLRWLLTHARRTVLVAGYRITEREVLEPLVREAARRLDVRVFFDIDRAYDAMGRRRASKDITPDYPARWFAEWLAWVWPVGLPPPEAYYAPSALSPEAGAAYRKMHMKTVVVDGEAWFVSSANFGHYGTRENFELGARIDQPAAAQQVLAHFAAMIEQGVFVRVPGAPGGAT